MWTSPSPSSLFLPTRPLLLPRNSLDFYIQRLTTRPLKLRLSASVAAESTVVGESWIPPPDDDECNGWALVESREIDKRRRFSTAVLVGAGASVVLALAAIGYFSVTGKGFLNEFRNPFAHHENVSSFESENDQGTAVNEEELSGQGANKTEGKSDVDTHTANSGYKEKVPRILKPVAVDSTQEEAISVLTRLKIIESDIEAGALCTRMEFARWLVKANTLLERNPRHRIILSISLSGSTNMAFDDITTEHPDFSAIQGLAEAGILPSRLSSNISSAEVESSQGQGVYFFPERPISRQDLINWKAHFEYESVAGIEEASRPSVGFLDIKTTSLDVSPALCLDMLAGNKSIFRKVFGKTMRFEPKKPVTKAQAAVALTSGRMAQVIEVELQRLEAEKYARELEIDEIRSELLERGEINKFWDQKLNEEYGRRCSIKKYHLDILDELEQEKVAQEIFLVQHTKEKSAMDCQWQLILSLKDEISETTKRIESERVTCAAEQQSLQNMRAELQSKLEAVLDAKSVLEAEKQAVTILRTWVEDEARKNQARAKLLEEVGRRWNWENHD
ncbi:unnamed protein product [Rhodiola kirilowii]